MTIQYRARFILHRERNGSYTIRLRVTLHGQRPIDFAVGCSIDDRDVWDDGRQRVRQSHSDAQTINRTLADYESKVADLMARYELVEKRVPSADDVKRELAELSGRATAATIQRDKDDDFFIVYDKFCEQMGAQNQWTRATFQKFDALKNHLTEYEPMLKLSKLDETQLQGFVTYMSNTLKLRNTTIGKQLGFLRWYLRWAAQHGYYGGNLHDTFRPKLKGSHFEQKEVIYLTLKELQTVENHQFKPSQKHLEHVRDVFVFCCYTGLRFSDAAKLRRSDIHDDYISVVTKKTSDRLRIELNRHSRAILDRYSDCDFPNNLALPVISNQKTNDYLKEIGKECELNENVRIVYFLGNKRVEEVHPKRELLTTHVARRTFVVTALQLGVPAEVITRWTGHSDMKSMKPYVAIVDELKAKNMSKFDTI